MLSWTDCLPRLLSSIFNRSSDASSFSISRGSSPMHFKSINCDASDLNIGLCKADFNISECERDNSMAVGIDCSGLFDVYMNCLYNFKHFNDSKEMSFYPRCNCLRQTSLNTFVHFFLVILPVNIFFRSASSRNEMVEETTGSFSKWWSHTADTLNRYFNIMSLL